MEKARFVFWIILACFSLNSIAMPITLGSKSFSEDGPIPAKYTCDGIDISPELTWNKPIIQVQSYVIIVDDPDAPRGIWTHWVVFNIPANVTSLAENTTFPSGGISSKNSWGTPGYRGPCPPSGTHRYFFNIYALDTQLDLTAQATKEDVLKAMNGHIVLKGLYIGLYSKKNNK